MVSPSIATTQPRGIALSRHSRLGLKTLNQASRPIPPAESFLSFHSVGGMVVGPFDHNKKLYDAIMRHLTNIHKMSVGRANV
jgi:hypothetical protein